jgi:hypothetical protein
MSSLSLPGMHRLRTVLAVLCILSTMLDSGGEIGLRLFGLAGLLILCIGQPASPFQWKILLIWLGVVVLLIPSIVRASFAGIELKSIIIWTYPFLAFPMIYFVARSAGLKVDHFVWAGLFFALIIIALFVGRITGDASLMWLNEKLTSGASGFFNQKQVFFQDAMPVVYFQGTLSLVFVSILAFGRGYYIAFFLMLVALILAPSRFGVTVSLGFAYLLVLARLGTWPRRTVLMALTLGVVLIAGLFAPSGYVNMFDGESAGSLVRLGHVQSLLETFDDDISKLLLGSGPGSSFYSSGFGEYTDNIEISQLELIRKFGIGFFIVLTGLITAVSFALWRKGRRPHAMAVAAHFLVATSNPVLLTAVFLLYFSTALIETEN